MAVYSSNMIRQYRATPEINLIPPNSDYSLYEHPVRSIGLHHNLHGFELGLSEDKLPRDTRQVVTIHDSQEIVFPHYFSSGEILRRGAVYEWIRRDKPIVICISEFTKNTLINRANLPASIMHVVPHGFDHLIEWGKASSENYWYANQEFIYVPGKAWKHKGHLNVLGEVAKNLEFFRDNNLKIYFACSPEDLGLELQNWLHKHKANDVLYLIPGMSNEQHLSLMRSAALILLPSMYEGFGLSYGEGIYLNKKIVAFNLEPYLEVSRQGHFVDPGNYEQLMQKTLQVYQSKEVNQIDKSILDFTWKSNVEKIIDLARI
jgi:glycosyltransferase involved in cell wall biosynthesis